MRAIWESYSISLWVGINPGFRLSPTLSFSTLELVTLTEKTVTLSTERVPEERNKVKTGFRRKRKWGYGYPGV